MKKMLVSILFLCACSNADIKKATAEAEKYASHIQGSTGVSCNDSDSDGDGYVSCTVFRDGKDPLAISCGAEIHCVWNCASGCKLTPMKAPTSGN